MYAVYAREKKRRHDTQVMQVPVTKLRNSRINFIANRLLAQRPLQGVSSVGTLNSEPGVVSRGWPSVGVEQVTSESILTDVK